MNATDKKLLLMLREETENCFCVGFINDDIMLIFAGGKPGFGAARVCLNLPPPPHVALSRTDTYPAPSPKMLNIVKSSKDGTKLRLPQDAADLVVACPTCHYRFAYNTKCVSFETSISNLHPILRLGYFSPLSFVGGKSSGA